MRSRIIDSLQRWKFGVAYRLCDDAGRQDYASGYGEKFQYIDEEVASIVEDLRKQGDEPE